MHFYRNVKRVFIASTKHSQPDLIVSMHVMTCVYVYVDMLCSYVKHGLLLQLMIRLLQTLLAVKSQE